jgi:hypothetical protein
MKELDSDLFTVRDGATHRLEQLGESAVGSLKRALPMSPSLEVRRRIEGVIEKLETRPIARATLREIRAVEALEYCGGAAARKLLQELARGDADARLTLEAKESLARRNRFRQ